MGTRHHPVAARSPAPLGCACVVWLFAVAAAAEPRLVTAPPLSTGERQAGVGDTNAKSPIGKTTRNESSPDPLEPRIVRRPAGMVAIRGGVGATTCLVGVTGEYRPTFVGVYGCLGLNPFRGDPVYGGGVVIGPSAVIDGFYLAATVSIADRWILGSLTIGYDLVFANGFAGRAGVGFTQTLAGASGSVPAKRNIEPGPAAETLEIFPMLDLALGYVF